MIFPSRNQLASQADHADGASGGCHQGRPGRNPAPSTPARSNGTTSFSTVSMFLIAPGSAKKRVLMLYFNTNVGATLYWENRIKIFSKSNSGHDFEYGESGWRHEFGHAMDWWYSNERYGNWSLGDDFRELMHADRMRMTGSLNKYEESRRAANRFAGRVAKRNSLKRKEAILEVMEAAGLDEEEVRDYFQKYTIAGYTGEG